MQARERAGSPARWDPRSEDFVRGFGAKLVDRGLLDELALGRAKRAQAQAHERFDLVLTRLGLVNDDELADALADFLDIPRADPESFPESPLLKDQLPAAFLAATRALPISLGSESPVGGSTAPAPVIVATADPFNGEALAAIAFLLGRPVEQRLATPSLIEQAIERLYGPKEAARAAAGAIEAAHPADGPEGDDVRRLKDMASEAPVIRLVQDLITRAVEARASDIHIEPGEDCVRVRFRLDGHLHTVETLPLAARLSLASRIKIMAGLDIAERRLPQDGRIAATVRGRDIDLRVSTMPAMNGESVVLRILDRSSLALDFAALGFAGAQLDLFRRALSEPNGMILVTGPTGSGKTTTLYAALDLLNRNDQKLFTVEDPVEYQIAGINQVQVNPRIGLTFASALRSILRQDPDIVMVGEIRDLETAEIAIRAALTGHLVLSTVHTNSAAATITRLLDMGTDGYLIASTLKGVLAQRLVRRLCRSCAKPAAVPRRALERLFGPLPRSASDDGGNVPGILEPGGCPSCRSTGYSGRTVIYEFLPVTSEVRAAILEETGEAAVARTAAASGMASMLETGLTKVLAGETSIEEVLRVTRAEDAAL
jgi:general secretion pathway protein E